MGTLSGWRQFHSAIELPKIKMPCGITYTWMHMYIFLIRNFNMPTLNARDPTAN